MHEGVAPFANDHSVAGAIARTANFEDGASALGHFRPIQPTLLADVRFAPKATL